MRKYIDLNKRWLFSAEEKDGVKAFDDTLIDLPFLHSAATMPECTFSAKWTASEEDDGKTLYVQFRQLTAYADIYLGDKFIGSHTPSDSSFTFLLTLEAQMGTVYDIIVKLRPTARADGFFVFAGASLITADSSHFNMLTPGGGIYITTETADNQSRVSVKTDIVRPNNYDVVSYTVQDMKGETVFSKTCKPTSPDIEFSLGCAELWEGQSGAYLYKLTVSLLRDSACLDELTAQFGIRDISLKPDGFFYLNGFRLPLNGIELTDCSSVKNDIRNLLVLDANTLVSSYLPTKTDLMGICDTHGILFWYSLPFTGDRKADMSALREFLLSNRNHPSLTAAVCSEQGDAEYFTEFTEVCKEAAPFVIPVLKRNIETAVSDTPENAKTVMITLPFMTDSETFIGINGRFSELIEKFPDRFFAVYTLSPDKTEISLSQFNDWHIRMWDTFCRQKGVIAYFGGLLTDEKTTGNRRGLTSSDRTTLSDSFHFYRSRFSSTGFIKICENTDIGTEEKLVDIKCITNCDNLRLLVNGRDKKYTAEKLTDGVYVFRDIKLKKDSNLIEVSAGDECDSAEITRG